MGGHRLLQPRRWGRPSGTAATKARPVRRRLTRILALPLVAVLVLLSIVTVRYVRDFRVAAATTGSIELTLAVQDLVQELQQERGLTSGLLGGNEGFHNEIAPARDRVDAERANVGRLAAQDTQGAGAVRTALHQFDDLDAVRAQVDAGKAPRADTFQYFTDGITRLNGVDFGLGSVADERLRNSLAALRALSEFKEQTAQERAFLNGVYSAGGFDEGEYVEFAAMNGAQQAAQTQYLRDATPAQRSRFEAVLDTGAASEATYFEQVARKAADGRLLQVNPQSWWSALTTVLDGVRGTQQAVGDDIQHRASLLRSDATRNLVAMLIMGLLCIGGAIALVVSATRSITGPLAALAAEADSVASQRLPSAVADIQSGQQEGQAAPPPVQVPARASSEIQSVAAALDRVQATAYALAADQAVLRKNTTDSLANLARRNQNLLRRQLSFITRLEQDEADPSALANLFELDHLATRMRRNAESLLVLVGESTPRRWSVPLPIADVIRAAISEVEEYRRVTLRRIDDAYVNGNYITNLAHILAELVENALTFSPPDRDVEIQGRRIGTQYLIAVTDQGIGMNPEDLEKANARLCGEESFLLSPTRFLGHYVVGQLARDMAVDVQVALSPVHGITARVIMPEAMLDRPGELSTAGAGARTAAGGSSRPEDEHPEPEPAHGSVMRMLSRMAIDARSVPAGGVAAPAGEGAASDSAPPVPDAQPVRVRAVPPSGLEWWGAASTRDATSDVIDVDPDIGRDEAARTRNGLPKRIPKSRTASRETTEDGGVEHQPAGDLSPTDLKTRLTMLRAGVQRGENERTTVHPDATTRSGFQRTAQGRRTHDR